MKRYAHGGERQGPYFEGWYLKYKTLGGRALALIPALHTDSKGRRSASLQVITEKGSWYLEYPEGGFYACKERFLIRVGQNLFSEKGARLFVQRDGLSLSGELRHGPFSPLSSDIMGPFRFFSGMECAHGIVSMGHRLEGVLTVNGEALDFSGGIGYTETDRGRSFPAAYLWTQCAWQSPEDTRLMLSVAAIPLPMGRSFTGCICAVLQKGKEYRLATYRGARVARWQEDGAEIRQGRRRLTAELLDAHSRPLMAPFKGSMNRVIRESLCARVRYRFWDGEKLLFDHTDAGASFEYADLSRREEAKGQRKPFEKSRP